MKGAKLALLMLLCAGRYEGLSCGGTTIPNPGRDSCASSAACSVSDGCAGVECINGECVGSPPGCD